MEYSKENQDALYKACKETLEVLEEWNELTIPDDGGEWSHVIMLKEAIALAEVAPG